MRREVPAGPGGRRGSVGRVTSDVTPDSTVDEGTPAVVRLGDLTVALTIGGTDPAARLAAAGARPVLAAQVRFSDGRGARLTDVLALGVADGAAPLHDGPGAAAHHPEPVAFPDSLQADVPDALQRPSTGPQLRETLLRMHSAPDPDGTTWLAGAPADLVQDADAGVVRLDPVTGAGVAVAVAGDGRAGALDPYLGAWLAVAQAYRDVVTTGARPLAAVHHVRTGHVERPAAHWHLERVAAGVADACRDLGLRTAGGGVTVSGEDGAPSRPTPVVAVLGGFDDVGRATPSGWLEPGQVIYQLGATREDLAGSGWAWVEHGHLGGVPPRADPAAERLLGDLLVNSSRDGLVDAAHALGAGGLARALVQACLRCGVGARVWLDGVCDRDGVTPFLALFAETPGRAVVAVPRSEEIRFTDMCVARGYPVARIGVVDDQAGPDGAQALDVQGLFTVGLDDLRTG